MIRIPLRFSLSALIATAGGTAPLSAADDLVGIGFEYGIQYDLYQDHRWEGFSQSFAIWFPLMPEFSGAYYQEYGTRSGRDGGDEFVIDHVVHELRLKWDVWSGGHQQVSVLGGFGWASFDEDLEDSSVVGDIGGEVVLYRGVGPVSGRLGFRALYRYLSVDRQDIDTGPGEFFVSDFTEIQFGAFIGLYM